MWDPTKLINLDFGAMLVWNEPKTSNIYSSYGSRGGFSEACMEVNSITGEDNSQYCTITESTRFWNNGFLNIWYWTSRSFRCTSRWETKWSFQTDYGAINGRFNLWRRGIFLKTSTTTRVNPGARNLRVTWSTEKKTQKCRKKPHNLTKPPTIA